MKEKAFQISHCIHTKKNKKSLAPQECSQEPVPCNPGAVTINKADRPMVNNTLCNSFTDDFLPCLAICERIDREYVEIDKGSLQDVSI